MVHTQGSANTRRSEATVGVLLFKGGAGAGPRAEQSEPSVERSEVHTQGGAYTRWCTHKAVQTQSGLWPPVESCYLRGVRGLVPLSSEASHLSSEVSQRGLWGGDLI